MSIVLKKNNNYPQTYHVVIMTFYELSYEAAINPEM